MGSFRFSIFPFILVPSIVLGSHVGLNIGMKIVQVLEIVQRGGFEFHWMLNA